MDIKLEAWQIRAMHLNSLVADIGAMLAEVPAESFDDARRMYAALEARHPDDEGIRETCAIARRAVDATETYWRMIQEETPKVERAIPGMAATLERLRQRREAT